MMFRKHSPRQRRWVWEVALVVAALLVGLWAGNANAADPPKNRKMARQIRMMEGILNQVLLDSPNFLVGGIVDYSWGFYVEGHGVILTFDASLITGGDDHDWKKWTTFPGLRIEKGPDGQQIIIIPDDDDLDEEDLEELEEFEDMAKDWRDREGRRQERVLGRGKTELVDLLLDYGDTMTTLESGEWISIVAALEGDFLKDSGMRLILKAKIDDLRAYGSDDLSEEEMVKRIVVEEY